jgi:hypothetical protein
MTKAKREFKVARFGSVSSGTMRPEDLIPAFADELRSLGGKCATKYQRLANIGRADEGAAYWDSEDPQWDLESLFSALEEHAPPFGYFGSSDGDGADYGFWPSWDAINDAVSDGSVLKINAGDERPDPFPEGVEYVLEVNDHGNASLYATDGSEVWGIV